MFSVILTFPSKAKQHTVFSCYMFAIILTFPSKTKSTQFLHPPAKRDQVCFVNVVQADESKFCEFIFYQLSEELSFCLVMVT